MQISRAADHPSLDPIRIDIPMNVLRRALLPVLALVPLAACAVSTNPVSGRQRAYAYSWEQEIALGREADREIVEQFGLYDDPELSAYVERVGQAVLAESHLRRPDARPEYRATEFTFRVLDSEIVNAFALPGGFVYVTRGLLAHLENEAQLAVVLGHEVGHVAARHTSQDMFESGLATLGLLGASLIAEELAGIGDELAAVGGIGMQLMLFRYSRDDERESDRLGVEYAARAGYAAAEGADFFTALQRMQLRDGWFPAFLSTHPDPGRRHETVVQLAEAQAQAGFPGTRVEGDAYLARIDGIPLGEDPRQGFTEDGIFYHPAGAFQFVAPAGWDVYRDGREAQLLPVTDGDEEAQYGILFRAASAHGTGAAASSAFVADNELGNARVRSATVNGMRATRVDGVSGEGDARVRVVGVFLEHGGAVRSFVGIAPEAEAGRVERAMDGILGSFRPLDDSEILAMEPAYLELVTVRQDAAFADVVGDRALPYGMDLEALAILNGLSAPADVVPAGRIVKLPD